MPARVRERHPGTDSKGPCMHADKRRDAERPRRSLNDSLVESLRNDILRGRLRPGERLKTTPIAFAHNASLTVVREALNRLAGERLVEFEPRIGFAVRTISADDLRDLVEQRVIFESIALRRCMQSASVEWHADVLAAHHLLAHTVMTEENEDGPRLSETWITRHDRFHEVVLSRCGSPRLFDVIRRMAAEAEVYQRALLPHAGLDRQTEDEHRALTEAILAGDIDQALALLARHQESTRDEMLPLLTATAAATP